LREPENQGNERFAFFASRRRPSAAKGRHESAAYYREMTMVKPSVWYLRLSPPSERSERTTRKRDPLSGKVAWQRQIVTRVEQNNPKLTLTER
jgi:hypothetical protein